MNSLASAQQIELDELPRYSHWIPFLLGLKSLSVSLEKSAESIGREYGEEKWGVLLRNLQLLDKPTIAEADKLSIEKKRIPFFAEGRLFVDESAVVQNCFFQLVRDELSPLIEKSGHLVELGSGYGSIILKLATLPGFDTSRYTAGEFTDSGVACINLLSSDVRERLKAGYCDLNDLDLGKFDVPENAIFMTCWAAAYIKGISRKTLNEIINTRPAVVVHFEPIYEHWSDDSLLHMLWKRYCQMNDYNRSLLASLEEYESEGLIRIIEERKSVFGVNPLAPVSIVKWVPTGV